MRIGPAYTRTVMDGVRTASSSATPYRQQRGITLNNTPNQVSVVVYAVLGNDAVVVRLPGVPAHATTRRGVTVTPLSTHFVLGSVNEAESSW